MVQERLDPIDWATYEPYLWANEAAFCRRSAVLFGALTRLSASPPQARPDRRKGAVTHASRVHRFSLSSALTLSHKDCSAWLLGTGLGLVVQHS